MYKLAQRLTLSITLFFLICSALLLPTLLLPASQAAQSQGQGQSNPRAGRPKQGKPEGIWPDLEDVKGESSIEREAPAPIPSTIRSPKISERPWNGRRVGDPETQQQQLDQAALIDKKRRRAHASRRTNPTPPIYEDQFIQNFFSYALLRSATSEETLFWNYQLRAAYNQGAPSLKLASVGLGKTLFESASYAARNRDNHWYVYDLYRTFLMRDPDASGWAFWESQVPLNGRENVRRAFEEAPEFATLLGTIVLSGAAGSNPASLITARVERRNQPGNGMLSRDASWSVSLLSLPGRNGLDLGLALSYSSMVWTPSGPYFHFDEDNGFPSPGFRLGFPTVQRKVFDAQTAKNSFLLITPSGHRVELRQVGTSNVYEAGDSSYLQLTDNSPNLLVRSTDGTQLSFVEINNEFSCTQVKDRNGNYITVNHNALGRITSITDTLGRVINFNYDSNANLTSITQAWNGQPSHQWVSFGWSTRNMQYGFATDKVIGTVNGMAIPVITQVALNDTSHFTFEYTNSLQVSQIKNYFGAVELNATTLTYETPSGDVPRLSSSSVSARNWTGYNNVPALVTSQYSIAGDGACVLTAPDGTIYKEYYGTGWQKGLTVSSEVWSGGVKKKWTTTAWTQDNTAVSYEQNPRVTETNVYDSAGNRRRVVIEYGSYAPWGLPYGVREFANDGVTEIRQTWTDYDLSQAYLDRRIIGLVSHVHLSNVSNWQSKISYSYDDPARLQAVPAAATQHDPNYNTSLTARGNVTGISQWDVTDINNTSKKLTAHVNYYTTGTPISSTDPSGHQSSISYTDSFSDSVNRNTFAYATTTTDEDGNSTYMQYNFDLGATTRTQSPAPAGQAQGVIKTMAYNNLGQLERVTTFNNNAYKRFWYGADYTASYDTVNNAVDELYSIQVTDGLGRPIGVANNHPGSYGGYTLVNTIYDRMGRVSSKSNPTEVNVSWVPSGDDAAGIYYTQQTYDWKGRPLVTTNPDLTTKTASYSGCGCAGGDVITLTDEGTIDSGVTKRRQQRIYLDVRGRTVKSETLNWQGGSVYAATVNTYNVRDQVTQTRQYAGPEGSGTYQDTYLSYDGYGRLKTKHRPEQSANFNTVWDYNADGTIQRVTDARGATTTYAYNNRHLPTSTTYGAPAGITVPQAVSYTYDAAANRTLMIDGTGTTNYSYDALSRLTSESRTFTGFSGTYALNYSYNLADQLTNLSIPFKSQQIGYNYDTAGRLSGVTASGFSATYYVWPNQFTQNLTSFASNITYRAWGDRKSMTYGNTTSEQTTYNSHLQPATFTLNNMSYQNTNICCTYPTYSTMTWTYGYYDDGTVKHAWDATNDWFDRAYKYDHAGRIKETSTFRRARGLSPYPTIPYPDPYFQTIGYDAFDHTTSRIGKLYTGEPSDGAAYVNNRRSDFGWEYDAEGHMTRDWSYTHTYDAAGALIHSVSNLNVGDGIQYPYQPRLDITQTYDGDGTPVKRHQISRLPGLIDWEGNEGPPMEDFQTTYNLKSNVLGATVVELGGFYNNVNIYANGQRIARDELGSVTFEHQNPVTPSWVTSHGHSGYRYTTRQERDSRGAEVPLTNPYAYAQSYVEMKFSQPLFIEGGDPFDYSGGCTSYGMPISCTDAAGQLSRGLGAINRIAVSNTNPRRGPAATGATIIVEETVITITNVWTQGGNAGPRGIWGYHRDTRTSIINLPQGGSNVSKPNQAVIDLVKKVLSQPACRDFMKAMLTSAETEENEALHDGDIEKIFEDFLAQDKGGIARDRQGGSQYGTVRGKIGEGNGVIYSYAGSADQDRHDASTIINELPHLAGTKLGWPKRTTFGDFALAQAIRKTAYDAKSTLRGSYDDDPLTAAKPNLKGVKKNPFEQFPTEKSQKKNEASNLWSNYVHDILRQHCPLPTPVQ